jgi:hypothetical protein
MVNKHENINVGVYWDGVCFPGSKLSGWSNTSTTVSSGSAKSTVEVHSVCDDMYVATGRGGQMAGCCVLSCAPAQGRPRQSEGPTPRCININKVIIFSRLWKSATRTKSPVLQCRRNGPTFINPCIPESTRFELCIIIMQNSVSHHPSSVEMFIFYLRRLFKLTPHSVRIHALTLPFSWVRQQ